MIKKLDHLVITTANMPLLVPFYQALGFSLQREADRFALFAGDFKINVHFQDHALSPHAQHVQPGSADLCFETDEDLAVLAARLRGSNMEPLLCDVPRTGARGAMQSLYLRDPDGNLIELCRYD